MPTFIEFCAMDFERKIFKFAHAKNANFVIGPSHDAQQYNPARNLLKATIFELFAKSCNLTPMFYF